MVDRRKPRPQRRERPGGASGSRGQRPRRPQAESGARQRSEERPGPGGRRQPAQRPETSRSRHAGEGQSKTWRARESNRPEAAEPGQRSESRERFPRSADHRQDPTDRTGEQRRERRGRAPAAATSWDPLAFWYNGWVGEHGSEYHRAIALPAALRLLSPQPGEQILDVGAGTGVPAPAIARAGARYVGVDASPRLIDYARKQHGTIGRFLVGDARKLPGIRGLEPGTFDAVLFLLSIQDMDPLQPVLEAAARMLTDGGRLVMVLTHPAFRVPRQSGWGWDAGRKLVYRRVDRYLTPLPVPMKPYPGSAEGATTRSFHRPLGLYVNGLAECGLCVDRMEELPAHKSVTGFGNPKAEKLAKEEIPLFLALRARKPGA